MFKKARLEPLDKVVHGFIRSMLTKKKLRGIVAHEFIHYVKQTIDIYQYAQQHGSTC